MKVIKAYQCNYCTYYKKTKQSVINHEDYCYHNPKNKACATCKHNVIEFNTVYNPYHGGDPGSTDYEESYNYCNKKEIELNNKTLRMNCEDWNF